MRNYLLVNAALLILMLGCGGPRVVTTSAPPGGPQAQDSTAAPAPPPEELIPIYTDDESAGPYLPPEIPPTRYAPYVRRAETPAPPLPVPQNGCHLAVEVRNYDGTDGCGILLETDDGSLLAVGNVPRGGPLEAGTRISIGYEFLRDQASTCSNADATIHVTCRRLLRVSSGLPRPVVCEAYDTPSEWLMSLAKDYSATYITRYPWKEDRYVYLVESPFGQYLYDCRGYLVCKPRKNCLGFIEDYDQGVVIFEG